MGGLFTRPTWLWGAFFAATLYLHFYMLPKGQKGGPRDETYLPVIAFASDSSFVKFEKGNGWFEWARGKYDQNAAKVGLANSARLLASDRIFPSPPFFPLSPPFLPSTLLTLVPHWPQRCSVGWKYPVLYLPFLHLSLPLPGHFTTLNLSYLSDLVLPN